MYYLIFDNHTTRNQAILSSNDYAREICENCGGIQITYKGVFHFKIMGKLLDYYLVSGTPVISERFLQVLQENGFTGYEICEAAPRRGTVTKVGEPIHEKYYRLTVTGRCGLLRTLDGEPFPYCRICHRKIGSTGLVTTGVMFAGQDYDGSDMFAFENFSNIPIVSEETKAVLLQNKLTNLRFVALNAYEYSDRILQSSVRRRLAEGAVYPELLRAWLKYGVVTEQELNEKLNQSGQPHSD